MTSVAAFMTPFDGSIVNLALPDIAASLHAQLAYLIWIPIVYLLVSSSLQTTMGRLGDLKGRKKMLGIGLGLFTLGSAMASLSNDALILIVNRIIQGAGGAIMSATTTAMVVDVVPVNERGRAIGINVGATYLGLTLGPVAGGFLVQALGWRSIFYVNIPIGIVLIALLAVYVPRGQPGDTRGGFDIPGAVSWSMFLVGFLLLLSQTDLGLTVNDMLILGAVCASSFVVFLLIESRFAKVPVIDLDLFTRNRLFAAGNLTAVFNYGTNQGTTLILSLYLQLIHGYSPVNAGLILFAQPLMMMLTAPVSGALSDRIDARILSSIGMFCRALGLLGLAFLGVDSPAQNVYIPLAIIGLGHGLFSSPNANSVLSSVPVERRGFASGTMGTVRTASNSFGIAVLSAITASALPVGAFSQAISGQSIMPQNLADLFVMGMSRAFLFAAGFSSLGVFTSLIRGKEGRTQTAKSAAGDA